MSNLEFDVHYADGRQSLVMEANLGSGWKKLKKTYGFFHQTRIPFRDGLHIRAQLSVFAEPSGFGAWAEDFPDIRIDLHDPDARYQILEKRLTVTIPLRPDQAWGKTPEGRPRLYIERLPLVTVGRIGRHNLQGLIVVHERSSPPISDVRVWVENKLVVPGGQPESNRRRH